MSRRLCRSHADSVLSSLYELSCRPCPLIMLHHVHVFTLRSISHAMGFDPNYVRVENTSTSSVLRLTARVPSTFTLKPLPEVCMLCCLSLSIQVGYLLPRYSATSPPVELMHARLLGWSMNVRMIVSLSSLYMCVVSQGISLSRRSTVEHYDAHDSAASYASPLLRYTRATTSEAQSILLLQEQFDNPALRTLYIAAFVSLLQQSFPSLFGSNITAALEAPILSCEYHYIHSPSCYRHGHACICV